MVNDSTIWTTEALPKYLSNESGECFSQLVCDTLRLQCNTYIALVSNNQAQSGR